MFHTDRTKCYIFIMQLLYTCSVVSIIIIESLLFVHAFGYNLQHAQDHLNLDSSNIRGAYDQLFVNDIYDPLQPWS